MSLFKFPGGARLAGRKDRTSHKEIVQIPIPDMLHIPLQQHTGTSAVPIVNEGDYVYKGQLIAESKGSLSAPVHASTSGTVKRIGEYQAPHPSGLPVLTLSLQPDHKDVWGELPPPMDPDTAPPGAIAARVAESGVVGMGGATFPSAVKLSLGERYDLDLLIINGAECEPYLCCDDRLMQERTAEILPGIRAMMKALEVDKACVAIEQNKPAALKSMKEACAQYDNIDVVEVPARYPMGSAKHLVKAVTGRETPATGRTAELGVVVHNVATAFAVYEAVYLGRPLISRVMTVSGGAIKDPGNYQTLVGTPASWLIELSGGFTEEPKQLLMGGPMMGEPLPSLDVPVIKGTLGVLALNSAEVKDQNVMPCIGCGSCVAVCPSGLLPMDMARRIEHEDIDGADEIGLRDCISCGSCNYVCPSHIPLVQFFNYAKGRLQIQDQEKKQHERIKILTERRQRRLEEERRQKEEKQTKVADHG